MKHITLSNTNFREMVETPFSVVLGIHVHKETRSKKLTECLSDLELSISYDKVMKIENDLGNAVAENISLSHEYLYTLIFNQAFHYILQSATLILKMIHQTGNLSFIVLLLSFFKHTKRKFF